MPILIFIFINIFGTHHFSLQTLYPMLDDSGEVVYDAAGDTVYQRVPYFKLTSQQNQEVTQTDLDSSLYIANFFTTACQDSCQEVFSELVRVQEKFANIPELKIVSFSVNPSEDSVQALQRFAAQYGIKPAKWLLLTGDSAKIHTLAEQGFHQPVEVVDGEPQFNQRLVLVDKDKKIRGVYQGADQLEVDRLVLEINVLLDEYSKRK
ncbi:SCO family protein [Pontibacter actiniarum]|uniref:SCO family protein n=1 Tax=Pontibacter actiniarum TaxID=323450 RepID=UPI00047270AE|nr:SCO family protein [Pontibacter actiniarum]